MNAVKKGMTTNIKALLYGWAYLLFCAGLTAYLSTWVTR